MDLLEVGILDVVVRIRLSLLTALETCSGVGVGTWLTCSCLLIHPL